MGLRSGFISKTIWTLGLTVFLIIGLIMGLFAALAVPAILSIQTLPDWLVSVVSMLRWVVMAALAVIGLAVLYRYGPARDDAEWQWITPGVITACIVWISASIVLLGAELNVEMEAQTKVDTCGADRLIVSISQLYTN